MYVCIYVSSVYHIFIYCPFVSYLPVICKFIYVSFIYLFDVYDNVCQGFCWEVTASLKLQFSLPFIYVGRSDWTQVIRHGGRCFHPRSHLAWWLCYIFCLFVNLFSFVLVFCFCPSVILLIVLPLNNYQYFYIVSYFLSHFWLPSPGLWLF